MLYIYLLIKPPQKGKSLEVLGFTWEENEAFQWADERAEEYGYLPYDKEEERPDNLELQGRWREPEEEYDEEAETPETQYPAILDVIDVRTGEIFASDYLEIHRVDATDQFTEVDMPEEVARTIKELTEESSFIDHLMSAKGLPKGRPIPDSFLPAVLDAQGWIEWVEKLVEEERETFDYLCERLNEINREPRIGEMNIIPKIFALYLPVELGRRVLLDLVRDKPEGGEAVTRIFDTIKELAIRGFDREEEEDEGQ